MKDDRIAVLSGDGVLPVMLADRVAGKNILCLVIVLQGEIERFNHLDVPVHPVAPGRVKKTTTLLQKYDINKLILIGKIDKRGFIERKGLDLKALQMIKKLKDGKDMSIFQVLLDEFHKIGVDVLDQDKYLGDMIAGKGILTKRKPKAWEERDARFGIEHAKKLATMEIGQTIVVKNGSIIAVEAVEGTNETIKRGTSLCGPGSVVCKAARKNQDRRFDIPGIGIETLKLMIDGRSKMLALESGKILIVDKEKVIKFANKKRISIIAI